jgi:hypothetical protein
MKSESVFVLNDIEKQIAESLIQKLSAGDIPAKGIGDKIEVSYEYYSGKRGKTVSGVILGCPYKLRYRNSNCIFFSAWNCKDVCGLFYDVIGIVYILTEQPMRLLDLFVPFEVDLHTERYVFLATDAAVSFVSVMDQINMEYNKVSHNSQYILCGFDESDKSVYDTLIQQLKTEGYLKIQILQIWIRGEILYYVIADGAVLRPKHQRTLTAKEEEDLNRKIYKVMNNKFHFVDVHTSV